MENNKISFNRFYKLFNYLSLFLIIASLCLLLFKGLNYGIDFKGGTLIELRSNNSELNITKLRKSLTNMNLGDVNVKKFGTKTDYLIKFEKRNTNNPNLISDIKKNLVNESSKNL